MGTPSHTSSWRDDLKVARDVAHSKRAGFERLLAWLESWRVRQQMPPGRDAALAFWIHQVKVKPREAWQLDQWKGGKRLRKALRA